MEDKPFHIELLRNEIQKRKASNPRYSMRAFSRYLGLGPSTLSRILSHNQDLSLAASKKIIKKLKLSPDDRRLFISSVAEEKKQRTLSSLAVTSGEDVQFLSSFEDTLRSSRDMIFVLDRTCRCVHANESASRLFNLPLNQMMGKTLDQLGVDQDIADKINSSSDKVLDSGMLAQIANRYACFGDFIFEILLIPVTSDDEEVLAVACHWRDITETVVMEDHLKTVFEAGQILSHSLEYKEALEEMSELLNESFTDGVVIKLFDPRELIEVGDAVLIDNFHQFFPLDEKNSEYTRILESKESCMLGNLDTISFNISKTRPGKLGSILCLPLSCRDQIFGMMVLLRANTRDVFSNLDQELARDLSLRAADTIDYCLLVEKCQ